MYIFRIFIDDLMIYRYGIFIGSIIGFLFDESLFKLLRNNIEIIFQ